MKLTEMLTLLKSINDWLPLIDAVWKFIVLLIGSFIGLKYLRTLTPSFKIEIEQKKIKDNLDLRVIKISIKNVSKVGVFKDKILVATQEIDMNEGSEELLSSRWKAKEGIDFGQSIEIFDSTNTIDPNEELSIERIYKKDSDKIVHIGVQLWVKRPLTSKILFFWWPYTYRWTTTKYLVEEI